LFAPNLAGAGVIVVEGIEEAMCIAGEEQFDPLPGSVFVIIGFRMRSLSDGTLSIF
jgi:hypothetical protein